MKLPRSGNFRAIGVTAAIAVGASLGVFAPPALAAPEANDVFAARTDLGSTLPVHASESNAEATRETGEPQIGQLGDSGHSLWWEWEAPASAWTTIGTCGSSFATVVGIYEGTELAHLTRVAEGNADEGPSASTRARPTPSGRRPGMPM
jgi:hypothetical protein